jgi:hypothetical protein
MSLHDELLRDKQIIKGAESYLAPGSVEGENIADEVVPTGDIADDAITAAKIASSSFSDGLAGGAGTAIYVSPDDSSLAIVATQLTVKAQGVGPTHLNVNTKGGGIVATGGVTASVDYDDANINHSGGQLQLKDGGVDKTDMAGDAKRHSVSFNLPAFVANNTVRVGLLCCPTGKVITIKSAMLSAYTIPVDADGTCTVRLVNYDVSATTDDEVVAAWDAEGLVAKTATGLVVITAADVNKMEEDDYLYLEMVNNSVAIDTPWAGAVLTLEYEEGDA